MRKQWTIFGISAAFVCLQMSFPARSQDSFIEEFRHESPRAEKSPESNLFDDDIPFSVLQQIASGVHFHQSIKADLTPEQLDAMKKAQQLYFEKRSRVDGLRSFIESSPWKNRRFSRAVETLRAEEEAELKKVWLSHIKPEQRAEIRRRNRAAILRAVSIQQSTDPSLLDNETSIDSMMSRNDMLSVCERPAVQDLLELTDEQFEQVERLRFEAEADAVTILRQMLSSFPLADLRDDGYVSPNSAWSQLNAETLKLLTEEQLAEHKKLLSNPFETQKMLQAAGEKDPGALFRFMMPHGVPAQATLYVSGIAAKADPELNNAFASPLIIEVLNLTEDQQKRIAELLKDSREAVLAEFALKADALNKRRQAQRERVSAPLKEHNDRYHVRAVSLLTSSQLQQLEKERLKGLGLAAFRKPEVCLALELTDDQKKSIEEIVARVPKYVEMPTMTSNGDFHAESEAFFKRAKENQELVNRHHQKQNEDLQKILTESQQVRFTEMTGYVFAKAGRL